MDLYLKTARATSRLYTNSYSTSFGLASRMFGATVRTHIYAIYGLTRIADEIVDTYRGPGAIDLLNDLEQETYLALNRGYSTNPIVHAFQDTARQFSIGKKLLQPFFASMRTDLTKKTFSSDEYSQYIHGSAEVVGLMCLRVFCAGNEAEYKRFEGAAASLGAAYQKVNFLRDVAADWRQLGRYYFPDGNFESLDEAGKVRIIDDIKADFRVALEGLDQLPPEARRAVRASYRYYHALLVKLERTPIAVIKQRRVRVSNTRKILLLLSPFNRNKL